MVTDGTQLPKSYDVYKVVSNKHSDGCLNMKRAHFYPEIRLLLKNMIMY